MVILEFVDVPAREETIPEAKSEAVEKKSGENSKPAEAAKTATAPA
jgi:hypothetical protein